MIKTTVFIILSAIAMLSFRQIDLSKSAKKKMDKAITAVWDTEVTLQQLDVSAEIIKDLKFSGSEQFHMVTEINGNLLGYIVITEAFGRYDMFDLLIIYDLELIIQKTQVLVYREDWGGEIASSRWMRQFIGLNAKSRMELTYDIQGISGATISCRSATQEIRRVTFIVNDLKERGILNI